MKEFLDTSVLVAAFLGDHEHHESSLELFAGLDAKRGACAGHSLLEVYATLTRLPGQQRVGGAEVMLFFDEVRRRLQVIVLDPEEYFDLVSHVASAGIAGGAIYDAQIGRCAVKARARTLYTWNLRDFSRLGLSMHVRTP